MDELVSIRVPVYRVLNYIEETISCVTAQTCKDWELLLVEDCGTDGTLEVIKRCMDNSGDARIRLIRQTIRGRPGPGTGDCRKPEGDTLPIWMRMTCGYRKNWSGNWLL